MPKLVQDNKENVWEVFGPINTVRTFRNIVTGDRKTLEDFSIDTEFYELSLGSPVEFFGRHLNKVRVYVGHDEFEDDIYLDAYITKTSNWLEHVAIADDECIVVVKVKKKDVFRRT